MHIPSLTHLDAAVESLSESLYKAASIGTTRRKAEVGKPVLKHNIHALADAAWSSYLGSNSDLTMWYNTRNKAIGYLKNVATEGERKSWNTILATNDSEQIWKGSLTSTERSERSELTDLCAHKRSIPHLCDVTGNTSVHGLDDEIRLDEIENAKNHLKEDKVSDDGWTKRMIFNMPLTIMYVMQIILNAILRKNLEI